MKRTLTTIIVGFVMTAALYASDGWLTDFEAAKKLAAKRNVPILADFSGSDWCGWCIRLEKEVFSKKEFKVFAKDHFVLFLADYPSMKVQSEKVKKQNAALQTRYGIRGFPTILILDSKGKVLKKTGYQRGGAGAYIKHLKKLTKGLKQFSAPRPLTGPKQGK